MIPLTRMVLGTMEIGRRMDLFNSKEFIDVFLTYGHNELDSAYLYAGGFDGGASGGLTEEYLGKIEGIDPTTISTKANPGGGKTLSPSSLRHQLDTSLNKLGTGTVDVFYLHWPCMTVPIEDTLQCVNELYEEGKFRQFGLSNFISWQVVEIQSVCQNRGYIKPTVYQGMYNCLTRMVEAELLPCLKRYEMSFLAYNPLAGGLLSGKHHRTDKPAQEEDLSGRFFGTDPLVVKYRDRYWRGRYFSALEIISAACKTEDIEVYEAALRWIQHHSLLDGAQNDGILIGSSNVDNLKKNMDAVTDSAPLPASVVDAIEAGYQITAGHGPPYFRNVTSSFG